MFNLFIAVSPEIFLINATFILLIHGVVFSTSKKYDYPPLVSNVGWLGLLSVARLGRKRFGMQVKSSNLLMRKRCIGSDLI